MPSSSTYPRNREAPLLLRRASTPCPPFPDPPRRSPPGHGFPVVGATGRCTTGTTGALRSWLTGTTGSLTSVFFNSSTNKFLGIRISSTAVPRDR